MSKSAALIRGILEHCPNLNHSKPVSIDTNTAPQVNGYLLLFRNTHWAETGLSLDEIHELKDRVNAWFDQLAAAGKLQGAQPLFDESVVISGKVGSRTVTDGPYVEAKETIGGYVLLSAASMEEAVEIARGNPMLDHGVVTEVRPTATSCPSLHRVFTAPTAVAA